ncbi:MAG TPA: transglycosylase SLT domain-containing protein [Tabrizicola sp.]|nr:transglycosylase SLT domain-containing protein [Tabrizicola sp.]
MSLRHRRNLSALALGTLLSLPVQARNDPSTLCLSAAAEAAEATGVPYEVLLAIAVVETGRDDRPWPWTVNVAGDGRWFDTKEEAETHAQLTLDQGLTNLDVGCFQLNIRWHSKGFASLSDMLDPNLNAGYAAEFLAGHYSTSGNWADAAAAYHSATPDHADRYRALFEQAYAGLSDAPPPDLAEEVSRDNRFPLLLAGPAGGNGSLVPQSGGGGPLIGDY